MPIQIPQITADPDQDPYGWEQQKLAWSQAMGQADAAAGRPLFEYMDEGQAISPWAEARYTAQMAERDRLAAPAPQPQLPLDPYAGTGGPMIRPAQSTAVPQVPGGSLENLRSAAEAGKIPMGLFGGEADWPLESIFPVTPSETVISPQSPPIAEPGFKPPPGVPEGLLPPTGPATMIVVPWINKLTGERWLAGSGGYTPREGSGWEPARDTGSSFPSQIGRAHV